ncbi:MAG: SPFH domain-containing protein [Planctomycetia bacterium]|nr:SPFH domain-containing protein [Planctomycetia bacterium]
MLGIRYLKVAPTTHVLHFKRGKIVREGAGLSFFYFAPTSTIVAVPVGTTNVPFVFNEVTADFQEATIQGEITYRVADAARLAKLLDFSVDSRGRYQSDDPMKLGDRLIHATQILARSFTQRHQLRELLTSSDALIEAVLDKLAQSTAVGRLGVEIVDLSVLAIKATPEMAKAFQADAREEVLRKADEAIYARRNAAVELERTIKENELNTEIAVEQKRRQVRETQMAADVAVEEQRATLVERRVENERKEADARGHALRATLEPLKEIDWRTLTAATSGGDAALVISTAFRELAENASRIGELNISPELLTTLLRKREK